MEVSFLHYIPLLPLIGAAINGIFGRWLPKGVVMGVACGSVFLSLLLGATAFVQLSPETQVFHELAWNWFAAGSLHVDMAFMIDRLSGAMTLVVTGVGLLIHFYSGGYMEEDPGFARYFAYLNLFIAAMLTLVLGDNLVAMFVGWEGVGLCSYLLIGFWFTDEEKAYAGRKAFVVNRIGDFGFLIGIFVIFNQIGSVAFSQINAAQWPLAAASIAAGCLFLRAAGTSAPLPLYVWLPDAMAGPTPVSALIHAATMVTAGVYMVARASSIYIHAPTAMMIVAIVGAATALFAATIGLAQWDIKKVLAYSTISQLGYMFLACGVGAFGAGIFHVFTHAFFKALLFLGSGSVIIGMHHEQDMRRMGGLKKYMPITFATMLTGWLAISGIPLLSGFFSKDEILYRSFVATGLPDSWARILWFVGAVTALVTAVYMTRLMVLTFWGSERFQDTEAAPGAHSAGGDHHSGSPHESPVSMVLPLIVLAAGAVFAGYLGVPEGLSGGK